jgi:catechol 2,3-dioxygenase-like lactoylglutathione lyase family enzyme
MRPASGTVSFCIPATAPSWSSSRSRHLCFEVDDLEAFARHLADCGYRDVTIKRGRTDGILQCFIRDPDGVMIELQQHDEQSALLPYVRER